MDSSITTNSTCSEEIDFGFPFTPYEIQFKFMKTLYSAIDDNKIGIFESPTGTGKSLSLICGSLKWLQDYEEKQKKEIENILSGNQNKKEEIETKSSEEPSWVDDFFEQKAVNDLYSKVKDKEENKKKMRSRLQSVRKDYKTKKRKLSDVTPTNDIELNEKENIENIKVATAEPDEDADIILKEYSSDNETSEKHNHENSDIEDNNEKEEDVLKIFYCSRTHSQLNQFVHEVQKSKHAGYIKMVALASRQSLCINSEVQQLKSSAKMNEKCLDMQHKEKTPKIKKDEQLAEGQVKKRRKKNNSSGCPFYSYKKFHELKDHVSVDVQDIEQLVSLGKDLDTCPYYGSRHSVAQSQLVVLPYQMLLHKSTRESLGIKLKGNIVIIDEAHNLIETINSIHSVEIKASQILSSVNELSQYKEKYKKRLKAKNIMYIDQILYVLNALIDSLKVKDDGDDKKIETEMMTINNFTYKTKIDNVNLFKIKRYCQKSLISKKLNGFVDRYQGKVQGKMEDENISCSTTSQFYCIEGFLDALTNVDKDGRILLTKCKPTHESKLKFLLLNPAVHFIDVLSECKSVIIAGGTMQPISEFKNILLHSANVGEDRITEFSCGHVIPPENLTVVAMEKGPSGITLDFSYKNRHNASLIDELGRLLCNICTVTPGGVVCFFASYDYEQLVYSKWWANGMLQKISARKKIFREPKKSGLCDKVLQEYTDVIKKSRVSGNSNINGALLLSVVGGKMSEGINFSDDLGRCIVMIGLPYPNITSPELKEKMDYLNKNLGPTAGQEHYENICMKAVNQSIGRAIRHKEDYATILLLDHRYSKSNVQNKLPAWIKSRLQVQPRFGPGLGAISKFFANKRPIE